MTTPAGILQGLKYDPTSFDQVEAVTLYSRQAGATSDTFTTQAVVAALRRAATKEDMVSGDGGRLSGTVLVWHLPAVQLGAFVPKVTDVIQDAAGVRWTVVKEVGVQTFTTRYRCVCQQEV